MNKLKTSPLSGQPNQGKTSQCLWIKANSLDPAVLAETTRNRVEQRILKGDFTAADIDYISRIKRPLIETSLSVSDSQLEKLRRLCQLWDIEIKASEIKSHRKIIGPVIVSFKRLIYPILRVLLKDLVRQQRDFNAATISLLSELSNKADSKSKKV